MSATIVDQANTGVTALGGGYWRLTKTGGSDGNYDASAASTLAFPGDVVLRAAVPLAENVGIVGLTSDPAPTSGFTHLDFAVHLAGSVFGIYELGGFVPPVESYVAPVWIARIGTTISYRCGGDFASAAVLRSVPGVTASLFFDCALASLGASVDVRVGAPWSGRARVHRRLSLGSTLALS